jgi:hypothetical protein
VCDEAIVEFLQNIVTEQRIDRIWVEQSIKKCLQALHLPHNRVAIVDILKNANRRKPASGRRTKETGDTVRVFPLNSSAFMAFSDLCGELLNICANSQDFLCAFGMLEVGGLYFRVIEEEDLLAPVTQPFAVCDEEDDEGEMDTVEFLSERNYHHPIYQNPRLWLAVLNSRVETLNSVGQGYTAAANAANTRKLHGRVLSECKGLLHLMLDMKLNAARALKFIQAVASSFTLDINEFVRLQRFTARLWSQSGMQMDLYQEIIGNATPSTLLDSDMVASDTLAVNSMMDEFNSVDSLSLHGESQSGKLSSRDRSATGSNSKEDEQSPRKKSGDIDESAGIIPTFSVDTVANQQLISKTKSEYWQESGSHRRDKRKASVDSLAAGTTLSSSSSIWGTRRSSSSVSLFELLEMRGHTGVVHSIASSGGSSKGVAAVPAGVYGSIKDRSVNRAQVVLPTSHNTKMREIAVEFLPGAAQSFDFGDGQRRLSTQSQYGSNSWATSSTPFGAEMSGNPSAFSSDSSIDYTFSTSTKNPNFVDRSKNLNSQDIEQINLIPNHIDVSAPAMEERKLSIVIEGSVETQSNGIPSSRSSILESNSSPSPSISSGPRTPVSTTRVPPLLIPLSIEHQSRNSSSSNVVLPPGAFVGAGSGIDLNNTMRGQTNGNFMRVSPTTHPAILAAYDRYTRLVLDVSNVLRTGIIIALLFCIQSDGPYHHSVVCVTHLNDY